MLAFGSGRVPGGGGGSQGNEDLAVVESIGAEECDAPDQEERVAQRE